MRELGVRREVVLRALRAAGPPHSPRKLTVTEDPTGWFVSISDNEGTSLMQYIPPDTCRAAVNHLIDRFAVPRIWFYDPLTIPGPELDKPSS